MQKAQMMYEGKAKKVYATDDDRYVIVSYKDDTTRTTTTSPTSARMTRP